MSFVANFCEIRIPIVASPIELSPFHHSYACIVKKKTSLARLRDTVGTLTVHVIKTACR